MSLTLVPRPSDVTDHVAQFLLDQVGLGPVVVEDADDLVVGLEPAVLVGGHVRHHLGDHRVAVLGPKQRADAVQRQVELLVEHVFQVLVLKYDEWGSKVLVRLER